MSLCTSPLCAPKHRSFLHPLKTLRPPAHPRSAVLSCAPTKQDLLLQSTLPAKHKARSPFPLSLPALCHHAPTAACPHSPHCPHPIPTPHTDAVPTVLWPWRTAAPGTSRQHSCSTWRPGQEPCSSSRRSACRHWHDGCRPWSSAGLAARPAFRDAGDNKALMLVAVARPHWGWMGGLWGRLVPVTKPSPPPPSCGPR